MDNSERSLTASRCARARPVRARTWARRRRASATSRRCCWTSTRTTRSGGYPNVWTQYTVTISGVPTATTGRFALRYFVENGGPSGANSNYIGIDTLGPGSGRHRRLRHRHRLRRHRRRRRHHRLRLRPTATASATASASAAAASAAASASGPTAGPLSRAERDRPEAEHGEGTDPGTALSRRHGAQGSFPACRPCRRPEPAGRLGPARQLQGQPEGRQALTTQ